MIIDKTTYPWILKWMYAETHLHHYGQFPVGIRFHLGIIDNHNEMKIALESDNEFYIDDVIGFKVSTEDLKKIRTEGAFLYENNEAYDFEQCTPQKMKSLKNDHWEYLRTNTFCGERGRKVFGYKIHTYFPEENHSKVLFWNWVYQEFVLVNRIKTARPTSTLNSDDTIINLKIPHEGFERDVFVVTSTEDKYRNHTESLKDAKIFIDSDSFGPKVIYK
jgi:hypothetical protein